MRSCGFDSSEMVHLGRSIVHRCVEYSHFVLRFRSFGGGWSPDAEILGDIASFLSCGPSMSHGDDTLILPVHIDSVLRAAELPFGMLLPVYRVGADHVPRAIPLRRRGTVGLRTAADIARQSGPAAALYSHALPLSSHCFGVTAFRMPPRGPGNV